MVTVCMQRELNTRKIKRRMHLGDETMLNSQANADRWEGNELEKRECSEKQKG